jgi:phage terminase large subunit
MEDLAPRIKDTTATHKIFQLSKRIRAVAGGTSASKTVSILIWLIDYGQTNRNKTIDVVSESFPHLERGAMEDFKMIMKDRGYWVDTRWHGTKHMYTFETGTTLRFTSVDTYGKAHGPRRDVLFVNESNNLSYKIVDQLIVRTREIVWLDWNPSEEFWFYTEIQGKRDDVDFITLTYLDNEALDPITIHEIETHRGDANWWKVYGMGQLGEITSRIYTKWVILPEFPEAAVYVKTGLDYGYTNDPSAAVDIYRYNGGRLLDEVFYKHGMSNKDIYEALLTKPERIVYPDSAEPKSNDELKLNGVTVMPVSKGPGSVLQGIQFVQAQTIYVTARSINVINEYRKYLWETDKDGKTLNVPEHTYSHSMDAIRYALGSERPAYKKSTYVQKPYETSMAYEATISEPSREDLPMRNPWAPAKKSYQQAAYEISSPFDMP